jgi:PAS domain S-box-containing protein
MAAVLIVAADDSRRTRLERALAGHSVVVAATDADALKLARLVDLDVVVRDGEESPARLRELLAALREAAPATLTILLGATDDETEADFVVPADFTPRALESALARALEKRRLLRELAALRARGEAAAPASAAADAPWDGRELARVLKQFTRAFAAGFDLPRAIETFLDAISDVVRPARVALLLPGPAGSAFRISAHRGLASQLVESVRLAPTEGLARWLQREGRPALLPDVELDVAHELSLIHCVVAVPLLARGELVGVLALGPPLVRAGYAAHEIETLFDLGTHLATAVRDIALHHQLAGEKAFSERILAHMSSGVITIGRDHRVGTMNHRAEAILGLPAAEVVGQDLRRLPSPLGDMLFETLASGRATPRSEIQLALGARWLEVSTYPVRGEEPLPLGAVLVFEDLTAQKELAAQKRQAEQRELLTRVVARIADEIRNPLVSINAFVELIDERFDDPDFRKDFSLVVRRDVNRLVQVFEKLAGLVSGGELHFTLVDAGKVVDDLVASIEGNDESIGRPVHLEVVRDATPNTVRVDVGQLRRALSYLVRYLAQASATEPAKVSISIARATETDGRETVRVLVGSRTASVPPDTLLRLFDPVQMVQESLIDVGPAVSQRIVEALGGQLRLRQGRHELAFLLTLAAQA